jgi:hypothetical protein
MTKARPLSALDEEARVLLRRMVESLAWRQLASLNILGHCLKYVTELDVKQRVVGELDRCVALFRSVHALYDELGWTDLESAVRDRAESLPYPSSRLEFGVAYYVCGLAEEVAMQGYLESSCAPLAEIARSHVAAAAERPPPTRFIEYCSEPANRPQAQEFLDTWVTIARRSFGRADTPADSRAQALGLKTHRAAELDALFCQRLGPLLERCGLVLPALER